MDNYDMHTERRGRVRRSKARKKLILILVLLALCVAAVFYLISLTSRNDDLAASEPEVTEIADDTEDTGLAEDEEADIAADSEIEGAAEHVYSHRGSQGDDEYTIAAYDRAIEGGSRIIEADMVVSADGTIYVAHEDESKPMTGYDGYFSGMSDSQIDGLTTRTGNKIIKLSDLFDKYGDSVKYIVDIKYSSERNITAFTDIVKKYQFEDRVIAASMYPDALKPLETTFPDMTKLYICQDQGTFNVSLGYDYADILCVPSSILTEENCKAAHDSGKQFSAWTLNSEEEIVKAIEMGADSYFTDDSALAIKLEQENRE